ISGAPVTFTIVSGGGVLPDGATPTFQTTTNTAGMVAVDWHVGTSGVQHVQATAGSQTVNFHAFIAETLVVVRQPTLNPASGVPLATQPIVQLRDLQGNTVKRAGIPILAEYQRDPVLSGQTSPTSPQTVKFVFSEGVEIQTIQQTFSEIMSLGVGAASVFEPQ